MLRLLTIVLLFLLLAAHLQSQQVGIIDIDASGFPLMQGRLIALDSGGALLQGIASDDITITENGVPVPGAIELVCPPATPPSPVSALLVIDRSGSMNLGLEGGATRFQLVQSGAVQFVRTLRFSGGTGVAIVAFDLLPAIISDFRFSPAPLIALLNGLAPEGGTEFNPAFLDPLAGGIALLSKQPATIPRVLIFLTDGEPNSTPDVDRIVEAATAAKVTVHTITVGTPITSELRTISERTGGRWHSDVNNAEELSAIYTSLALGSQGIEPCQVSWISAHGCGEKSRLRGLRVTLSPPGITGRASYLAPASSVTRLEVAPSFIWYGGIVAPAFADRNMTVRALGDSIRIDGASLPPGTPFTIVDWGGSPPPFTLRQGESRTLTIRFTPADSSLVSESLSFDVSPCPAPAVTLSGGRGTARAPGGLRLLSPIGGESYGGCDPVEIRWGGVPPEQPISIDYSSDGGRSWNRISDTSTGLRYVWNPPAPGSRYRVRIAVGARGADTIWRIAGGGINGDGGAATDAELLAPSGLARSGELLYIAESGGNRVRRVDLRSGTITTVAGTGSSGYSNDGGQAVSARLANPSDIAISGAILYIADQSNHRIRRVDLGTGVISSIAGIGESGFSGDGGPAISSRLQYPSYLALNGSSLYFTDLGNNRVRRIDLVSGRITTVVGGGTNTEGDGDAATSVSLMEPAGIAIAGDSLYVAESGRHRVRRVDLRTGLIATAAGTATPGSSGDGGAATLARLRGPSGLEANNSTLYISDRESHKVRAVDLSTGRISTVAGDGVEGWSGDGGDPLRARFAFPGDLALGDGSLLVADVDNNMVRQIRYGDAGRRDSSRSSFSVATAQLSIVIQGKLVDFGPIGAGASRDTIIVASLCNRGDIPLRIDSARMRGADPADFQVVSGISSAEIAPGECRALELRFRPSAQGQRSANVIFYGRCGGSDTLKLQGIGVEGCGIVARERVDLGEVRMGVARTDTLLQQVLCNTGSSPIEGTISLRPASSPFSIVAGEGMFQLAPGACREITVRFVPEEAGAITAAVDYGIPLSCGSPRTLLYGRGVALRQLSVPSSLDFGDLPCPGDSAVMRLSLLNSGEEPVTVTGTEILPGNEGFSLLPLSPTSASPWTILPGESRDLAVRFNPGRSGDRTATLRIISDGVPSLSETTLSGRVDSFRVEADESFLVFDGSAAAGTFPHDSFTVIRNTGSRPLDLTGGSIDGVDSDRFDLSQSTFPIHIEPGESVHVPVRAIGPASDRSYRARLLLYISPACDSATVVVDLIESGREATLIALSPDFTPRVCATETYDDTLLRVHNVGGGELRITSFEMRGSHPGDFIFAPPLPIVIPPGETRSLPIRFAPTSTGDRSGELLLRSNGGGDSIIPLYGRRDLLAFDISPIDIDFGELLVDSVRYRSVAIRNSGTTAIEIEVPAGSREFTLRPTGRVTIEPGEIDSIEIGFGGDSPGEYSTSILFRELRCGDTTRVALSARVLPSIVTVLTLPVDSAAPGTRVILPIRIAIPDREAFNRTGSHGYVTTIRFNGAVLLPVDTVGADVIRIDYEPATATQLVTLKGTYDGTGDTLASLLCDVLQSDSMRTALEFVEFRWDRFDLLASTIDGAFHTIDTCYNGARVVSRPKILKVSPMPMSGNGVVELELEEPHMVRISLWDLLGREVMSVVYWIEAGRREIPFDVGGETSGVYSLVVETVFGSESATIVVVR